MTSLVIEQLSVSARQIRITENELTVYLEDGRSASVPLAWYPRLIYGEPQERSNWRFIGNGEGIHWPDLDEDIRIRDILTGRPSQESQKSFRRWLSERNNAGCSKTA